MNLRHDGEEQFSNPLVFDGETLGLSLRELGVDIVHADTTDIMSRWFHSVQDADLFIYSDSQQRLLKLQICFFGQVVEWNPIDGTRTGLIVESENPVIGQNAGQLPGQISGSNPGNSLATTPGATSSQALGPSSSPGSRQGSAQASGQASGQSFRHAVGQESSDEDVTETIQFDSRAQGPVITQAIAILKHVTYLSDEERSLYCYNLTQSPRLHKHARERALKTWAPKADEISTPQRPKFWKRLKMWVLG